MNNKDKFKLNNVEIYEKGDLKGYMQGYISFINKPEVEHEFLYRIKDNENGTPFTLVTIDYGYENNMVDELWQEIADYCEDLYKYRVFNKLTNFIV